MALWQRRAAASPGRVRLRAFRRADLPALFALDQTCFPADIAYSALELKSFLEHPSAFSVVACVDSRIVGFAIVRSTRRPGSQTDSQPGEETRPVLHILTIDVAPLARRQGVGASLMSWMIERAKQVRARVLVLEVAINNPGAQAFYQRFGFEVVGTIPGYYNGTIDALALERKVGEG